MNQFVQDSMPLPFEMAYMETDIKQMSATRQGRKVNLLIGRVPC